MISLMGHDPLPRSTCCHCIQNQGAVGMDEGVKGCWVDSEHIGTVYFREMLWWRRKTMNFGVRLMQFGILAFLLYLGLVV